MHKLALPMTPTRLGLILVLLLLSPISASAACTYIAELRTNALYIDISDGGCGPLTISFTNKIRENGRPDYATIRSFPFDEECVLRNDKDGWPIGLSCHAKGRTPLAGASYELRKVGYMIDRCADEGDQDRQVERRQYVCTAGCNRPSVPKVLDEYVACD